MSDTTAPSPATDNPERSTPVQRTGRRRRLTIMAAATAVLLAAASATYLLAGLTANDRMPRNATVDGASVDGLPRDEAARVARAGATVRLDQPVRLFGPDGWSTTIVPARAGFTLDADGALNGVEAPGWSPSGLWRWLTVPAHATSALEIDRERLSAVVGERTAGLAASPREPAIRPARRELVFEPGSTGWSLDVAATSQAVIAAVESGNRDVALAVLAALPTVSNRSAATAHARARDLLGRGLALKRDEITVVVPRRLLVRALSFTPANGTLQPQADGELLRTRLLKRFPQLQDPPRDAGFSVREGRPFITPARDGRTVDAADLANAVATAAVAYPGSGVVSVPGVRLAPELTDERAAGLGIQQRLSAFTQEYPYAPYRVQNIGRAARYVDGTLLLPGETFSMNDTIKERTRANGYTEGFIIGPGGIFREELGGGVSAATTAVWTSAFFAGMEPVQVRAHSIYIPRYAPGLEATVAWGVFDMKFRNDLPHAVLITARTTDTSMTVEFWGTRQYDKVKAVFGPRRDVVPYSSVSDSSPECLGQAGSDGFTIDVQRRFVTDREVVRSETITTTYRPSPRVICN